MKSGSGIPDINPSKMNRTLKYSLIGVGLTAATIVTISLLRRRKLRRELGIETPNNNNNSSTNNKPKGDDKLPLKKGSYGERVKTLQGALVKLNGYNLGTSGPNNDGVDGDFGPLTEAAVLKFQRRQDYMRNYGALSTGAYKMGEVDKTTYFLITGQSV